MFTSHNVQTTLKKLTKINGVRPCAVVVLMAVGTPLMVSTTPLTVGAGAVYGVLLGTAVCLFGAVLGAWMCFVIARYVE